MGCDNCISAEVISAIEVILIEGDGTEDNPCQMTRKYYTLDGKFLAENNSRKVDFKSELQKINNSKGGINRVDTKIKTVHE